MKTNFSRDQLSNPAIASCNDILRKCVHCGFCTATCPTYVTLGDELDSPRGRIYLIKDMLEKDGLESDNPGKGGAVDATTVKHIDRCLSCLSCMTTCPSGVHYMHLVDHAREHIQENFTRPLPDRMLRWILSFVLPRPKLFRLSLLAAKIASPFARLMPGLIPGRLKGLFAMAPKTIPAPSFVDKPQVHRTTGKPRLRVALLNGCAQKALDPKINEATVRLLNRHGVDVVVAKGAGCCGALTHHMGMTKSSHTSARRNIEAWHDELEREGLDYIVINTSGCGTTVKDYGFMFRNDPLWAQRAAIISAMARDITEVIAELELALPADGGKGGALGFKIAYHSACSMQHGQKITQLPADLLRQAGFEILPVPESHLCCGSAGTYNLLQPEMATTLRDRKVANIEATGAQAVAAGNLGCMIQIKSTTSLPVVHTAELLDWATGGPCPDALETLAARNNITRPQT